MNESIQRIRAAIAAFARGEIVIVADDDDRENEGDLFVAASLCTPEKMAFIIRNTSGIVCAPLDAGRGAAAASRSDGGAQRRAARHRFHRVGRCPPRPDHRHFGGRAHQHRARARQRQYAAPSDFVRPGHVFPLVAKEGGVLMRSGHTEACVDLCRLAGLPPVGVLAELMNDDGTVMRGPELARLRRAPQAAARHHRRADRLPPGARQTDRAGRRVSRRIRDRHARPATPSRPRSTRSITWRSSMAASATAGTCRRGCIAPI